MKTFDVFVCTFCVVLVSIGQVLLRSVAMTAQTSEKMNWMIWLQPRSVLAITIYGFAMLMWLWILGRVPITMAFSFFGLSFVLVPLLAHRYLGDQISPATWFGAACIIFGIMVSALGNR